MNFNSLEFLIFLPVVCLVHWLVPSRLRWLVLLAASLYFYMSWNVYLVILLAAAIFVSYFAGIIISRCRKKSHRKIVMWAAVSICLGILIFFKYADYIGESVSLIVGILGGDCEYTPLKLLLPVGISFYTFQTLSYVVDVYRGKAEPERHFGYYALYVCFFPQLVAGPIERPCDLIPQLRSDRSLDKADICEGLRWLLSGFIRKCVIADTVGVYVNRAYADLTACNSLAIFLGSALFMVQIYNDFAGYSEIAMGSARLLGVKLTLNFDMPLTSASVTEFFRRWHITLNKWFTDYVYIPLGGNRKGMPRKLLNTLIVFVLCGLWHGADNTYLLWGLAAGVSVCAESVIRKPYRKLCERYKILNSKVFYAIRRVFLLFMFTLSCVLFRSTSVEQIEEAFSGLFCRIEPGGAGILSGLHALGIDKYNILFIAAVVCTMCVLPEITRKDTTNGTMENAIENETEAATVSSDGDTDKNTGIYLKQVVMFVLGVFAVLLCWLNLLAATGTSAFSYFQF